MASVKLDPHKTDISRDASAGFSQRQLAQKYNVSRDTMQRWLKAEGIETVPAIGIAAQVPAEGEIYREELLQAEVRDLRARVRKERGVDVQAERVLAEIRTAIQAEPVRFEPLPPVLGTDHKPHVQALLLSDLHAGEVVRPEAIDGMNEFHWDVLVERMQKIHRALVSYQAARPYPIVELQQWWLGDMTSGTHHKELAESNEFGMAEQAFRVGMLLGQFVEELVPHYPQQIITGVSGNHGRMNKEPAAKSVADSFDWLAYKIAEAYLRNYIEAGSVVMEFPLSGFAIVNIAELNFLLQHGDGIRSSMVGFPGGGVLRRTKELRAQWLEKDVVLNGFAFGHFHQAHVLPGNVFVNGSVKGADEWCLKQFGSSPPPEQLLLTFDPSKRRRTDVSSITP